MKKGQRHSKELYFHTPYNEQKAQELESALKNVKSKIDKALEDATPLEDHKSMVVLEKCFKEVKNQISRRSRVERRTVAGVLIGDMLQIGHTKCGKRDQYRKTIGRGKAKQRALSGFPDAQIKISDVNTLTEVFMAEAKKLI